MRVAVKEESRPLQKKRTKRLFSFSRLKLAGHGRDLSAGPDAKVFWFFSSEKNILHPCYKFGFDFRTVSSDGVNGRMDWCEGKS